MDARFGMPTASTPSQLVTQPDKCVVDTAARQRVSCCGDEDGRVVGMAGEPLARTQVLGQGLHHAGVQGQAARLVELGLAHCERRTRQIEVCDLQLQGLGDSEPRRGDESEERLVGP